MIQWQILDAQAVAKSGVNCGDKDNNNNPDGKAENDGHPETAHIVANRPTVSKCKIKRKQWNIHCQYYVVRVRN